MIGGSASSGRSLNTVATRSRTSCAAVSILRLRSNRTMMKEDPIPEMDRSSWIPSTVFTASSILCETCASTSAGDAPGRVVRTLTVGRSTEGNRSTPRREYPTEPTTTKERINIEAKTGRLRHISASRCIRLLQHFLVCLLHDRVSSLFDDWLLRPELSGIEDDNVARSQA